MDVHAVVVVRTTELVPGAIHAHPNDPAEVQDVQDLQNVEIHVPDQSRHHHVVMFHAADQDQCEMTDQIDLNPIVVAAKVDAIHVLARSLEIHAMVKINQITHNQLIC